MPQFFFDLKQDGRTEEDLVGVLLKDGLHAEREALGTLGELLRDNFRQLNTKDLALEVRDDQGNVIIRTKVTVRHQVKSRD